MRQNNRRDQNRLAVLARDGKISARRPGRIIVNVQDEPLLKLHEPKRLADVFPFWNPNITLDECDDPRAARKRLSSGAR